LALMVLSSTLGPLPFSVVVVRLAAAPLSPGAAAQ
jgi:hypothetical protein